MQLKDLSNDRDGSVVGWMEGNGVYKVSTQKKGQNVIFNKDCSKMFYGGRFWCDNIELSKRSESEMKEVYFDNVDTSNVTDMVGMFACCRNLKKLDLSNFDTSNDIYMNVIYMDEMFNGCKNLEELNLSNWKLDDIAYLDGIFAGCDKLTSLETTDIQLKNEYQKTVVQQQNKMYSNIDLNNLKANKEKEMQKEKSIDKD